jgi:hypothetical protein
VARRARRRAHQRQVDHAFNRYQDNRWGMFGFLEFEDDPEVLPALLAAPRAGCAPAGAT